MRLRISSASDIATDQTNPQVWRLTAVRTALFRNQLGGLDVTADWASETLFWKKSKIDKFYLRKA